MSIDEVMNFYVRGLARWRPFAPLLWKLPTNSSFRVNGNNRLASLQERLGLLVNITKLGTSIYVLSSFLGLAVSLQTVPNLAQEIADKRRRNLMPFVGQCFSKVTQASAGPQERLRRITPGGRLNQTLEIRKKAWILQRLPFYVRHPFYERAQVSVEWLFRISWRPR